MAIAARYKGYRYPIEVIGHAVWLYHCFALSLRDVEELRFPRFSGDFQTGFAVVSLEGGSLSGSEQEVSGRAA